MRVPSPTWVLGGIADRMQMYNRDPGENQGARIKRGGRRRLRLCSQPEVIRVTGLGLTWHPPNLNQRPTGAFPMEQVELLADLLGKHP